MEIDPVQAIKESILFPIKDRTTWKYVFFQYALALVFYIFILAALVAFFGPIIVDVIFRAMQNDPAIYNYNPLAGIDTTNLIPLIILFVVLLFAGIIVYSFFMLAIQVLVINRALELYGQRHADFSLWKGLKLVALEIVISLLSVFSVYSKRLMIVAALFWALLIIAGISFLLSPLAGIVLLVLALVVLIPYINVVIYNATKLSLAPVIMLEGDTGIFDAAKKSFEITHGNTLMIFVTQFVLGIIIYAVSLLVSVLGFIPTVGPFINLIINFLFAPVFVVIGIFLPVAIYAQLKGAGHAQMPQNQAAQESQRPRWATAQ